MQLNNIFNRLTDIELSQLSIGGADEDGITEHDYPKIITAINAGMEQLYIRFPLKLQEIMIQQFDHITNYKLHSDFALSNTASTEPYKYINDYAPDTFTDDVIKIELVYNEIGVEVPLNDADDHYSFFTPEFNILQIPYPDAVNAASVVYRAMPTLISRTETDTTTEVAVPPTMVEPLIAYTTHLLVNDQEDKQTFLAKYLRLCEDLEKYGSFNVARNTNLKLWRNGWV